MVGCVIVRDGRVVGEGWHERAGGPHAEIVALNTAGDMARGATVYVTLEPCAHHGRTGPCTEALAAAGVARVIFAASDPNPHVAGDGAGRLRAAGIGVAGGLMAERSEALNAGFFRRMRTGRPRVLVKIASSLDGATAMLSGESQWITGDAARADAARLRAAAGAILTGIGTVLADDPRLTVRRDDFGASPRQPLRVVLDSRFRLPVDARMLREPGRTLVIGVAGAQAGPLEGTGAELLTLPAEDGRVGLAAVLDRLAEREVNDVMVEAGPVLAGALLDAGLVDELVIYLAPHIMGSESRRQFTTPGRLKLAERTELEITDLRSVGRDVRITARPAASS